MRTIECAEASPPGGHYSQAIVHSGMVYISGQLPISPSGERETGEIEAQTNRVIDNLEAIAKAAGSSLDRLVKVTVYVSDIALWGRVNAVYAERFGNAKPTRAVVPTRELHYGFLIEMDAIGIVQGE